MEGVEIHRTSAAVFDWKKQAGNPRLVRLLVELLGVALALLDPVVEVRDDLLIAKRANGVAEINVLGVRVSE